MLFPSFLSSLRSTSYHEAGQQIDHLYVSTVVTLGLLIPSHSVQEPPPWLLLCVCLQAFYRGRPYAASRTEGNLQSGSY